MTDDLDLGPELKPRSGGLLRLQRSVQQQHVRRSTIKIWAPASVAAGLIALALVIWLSGTHQRSQVQRAVQQALALPKTHFENGAYISVPSHRRDVRILLVATLPDEQVQSNSRR